MAPIAAAHVVTGISPKSQNMTLQNDDKHIGDSLHSSEFVNDDDYTGHNQINTIKAGERPNCK